MIQSTCGPEFAKNSIEYLCDVAVTRTDFKRDYTLTGPSAIISAFDWNGQAPSVGQGPHCLFNSEALAAANRLAGHKPFSVEVNGNVYLAYQRHASAVIGGLSLGDMVTLLENIPKVRSVLNPMGVKSLSLNTMNAVNDPDALATAIKLNGEIRFEFLLGIAQYSLNKLSQNHKRNIRKSIKAEASISLPVDTESMRSHIELVNTNLDNKGLGGISNSPEYFRQLIENNAGLLMQVTENGQLQASTFFITNKDYAYYHSSGTSDRGKQIGAAYFLVDSMIAEMRTRQMAYLNFGGCTSEQTGLCRFKMGFKPETRVLGSASRRLTLTARQRIRSLLSTRPEDILNVKTVKVYKKPALDFPPANIEGYVFEKMSYESLLDAVSTAPELDRCLERFCRPSPHCHALLSKQRQVLAIGFIETTDISRKSAANRHLLPSDVGEIAHLQVVKAMQAKGIGRLLIGLLEREVLSMGYKKVYCRTAIEDVASEKMVLAAGFEIVGEEKVISTAIMGGGSRIMGRLEV